MENTKKKGESFMQAKHWERDSCKLKHKAKPARKRQLKKARQQLRKKLIKGGAQ